jgi:hypothetical protein
MILLWVNLAPRTLQKANAISMSRHICAKSPLRIETMMVVNIVVERMKIIMRMMIVIMTMKGCLGDTSRNEDTNINTSTVAAVGARGTSIKVRGMLTVIWRQKKARK